MAAYDRGLSLRQVRKQMAPRQSVALTGRFVLVLESDHLRATIIWIYTSKLLAANSLNGPRVNYLYSTIWLL
jgi:hypothetical protein